MRNPVGLLDIFSKQSRVTRNVKKLNNKWVHMDERRSAIENLRTLGTDEAIEGLLQRFKFVIDNTTVDEDEKQNVCDALAEFGERSLPAVLAFLRKSEQLTWALKVLKRIDADEEKVVGHVIQILSEVDPLDKKAGERQRQLVLDLADYDDPRILDALLPLIAGDVDEDVQFHAIEAVEKMGNERAAATLLESATKHESIRLRGRALEAVAKNGWALGAHKDTIAKNLPPNLYIAADGSLHNRIQEIYAGLKSTDVKERRNAAREVANLAKPEDAVEALIEALEDTDAGVRASIVAALGKTGDFRATGPLSKMTSDPDADVRKKVEEALKRLRS